MPSDPAFFPIAVWLQNPRNAARYKEAGVNLYVGLWRGPTEEQLEALRKAGMPVICGQGRAGLAFTSDPIIVGWMHGDEPDNAQSLGEGKGYGPPVPPERIIADYDRMRAADPTRPVLLNLGQGVAWDGWHGRGVRTNHPEDYLEYVKGGDIISFDIYPVVHDRADVKGKLWYVARGVDRLREWSRDEKIVWNCIECTRISNPAVKPTPHQVRAEVWMSLIHGSRGLIYFVHEFKPMFVEAGLLADPEMLGAVTRINKQIHELAPVLNSPPVKDAAAVKSSDDTVPIDILVKRGDGAVYVFAVCMREAPAKALFEVKGLAAKAEAEVLGESRTIPVVSGRFEDGFGPYDVRLYRIGLGAGAGREAQAGQALVRGALVELNRGAEATAEFTFKGVPAPSKTDAGNKATFAIVAGELDLNGADLDALADGLLPAGEDEPDANVFFGAGTEGGRILADLGGAVEIKSVNTYSWHRSTRGPQVYRLFASDGTPKGFVPRPGAGADPEKAGWKLIASVDTRPKEGPAGGQYGVSIADPSGSPLGTYRYLLFDVSRTEAADPFGNTFLSEIDVIDGKEHAPRAPAAAGPGGYEIAINHDEMPELKDWVEKKLRPALEAWYPIIVDALPSEGFTAPRRLTVTFRKDMRGVAATGGRRIMCAGNWFKQNLEGEAVGAVVHELVHVAQQYRGRGNPGWLVEGVADYIRWFKYEPESLRPRPNPARAKYTDSYRTTGAFLFYLVENRDKEIVKKLNAAMRQGTYTPELWKTLTGKTVDELWADYVTTLEKR